MLRRILRYVYRQLLPADLRQSVDLFPCLRGETIRDCLSEQRILVLSPHPDDDVIGAGGTLHRYHQKGAHITSLYLTDGRAGSRTYAESELIAIRQAEARQAADIVGIDQLIFLDHRDSELALTPETLKELTQVLEKTRPEAVFLPFFLDDHADHMATNRIFLAAAERYPNCLCYAFGLWRLLPTYNFTVDITNCIDLKKQAIQAHASQVAECDLVGGSLGISKYYSIISGRFDGTGWAEVFIRCPLREYKRLAEAVAW